MSEPTRDGKTRLVTERELAKLLTPHPWAGAVGPIVGGEDDFVVIALDRGAPWKTTFAGPGEWMPWPDRFKENLMEAAMSGKRQWVSGRLHVATYDASGTAGSRWRWSDNWGAKRGYGVGRGFQARLLGHVVEVILYRGRQG